MKGFSRSLITFSILIVAGSIVLAQQNIESSTATLERNSDSETRMFRGGPTHNARYRGTGFYANNRVVWCFKTGASVQSSPAIYLGNLYVGSNDGYLYCLQADSGVLKWKFKATSEITSSPAVENGTVYFQTNDNKVYALNARTGKLKWRFSSGPTVAFSGACKPCAMEDDGWDFWVSSPVVEAGRLFIGSGDSYVYALGADTGKLLWKFKTGGRVRSSPALSGESLYVGSLDGKMYALDVATGREKWSFKSEGNSFFPVGEIQSSPALASGLVIFGSRDYNLYALDAVSGRLVWKNLHKDSWVVSSPAVTIDGVVVGSSDGKFVHKVDLKTGKEVWRTALTSNVFSSPAIAGGYIYVGTAQGEMVGLDEKTGAVAMGRIFDDRVNSSPVVANGAVFFGCENGYVYSVAGGRPKK